MKRLTYIGIIMIIGMFVCAATLLAGPEKYLSSESNSYGYSLPPAVKQAGLKTKAEEDSILLDLAGKEDLNSENRSIANVWDDNENLAFPADALPGADAIPGEPNTEPDEETNTKSGEQYSPDGCTENPINLK